MHGSAPTDTGAVGTPAVRRAAAGRIVVIVAALGILVACTGQPSTMHPMSHPMTRAAAVIGADPLPCTDPIDMLARPPAGMQTVLGVVAMETHRTLQASPSGEPGRAHRLYAKTGLLVRADRPFELVIPRSWRRRVAIKWGNTGAERFSGHLQIRGCPPSAGHGDWLVYPGGFFVPEPACVPLVVRTKRASRTVHVPVGVRCPATAGR